jgi:hypothetical protein
VIKPPSIQKDYTAFWSRDAAVAPLPESPTKEQLAERERLITLARDTGDLSYIEQPGERVTKFTMKPLSFEQYAELSSMHERGETSVSIAALAFRFALKDVAPLPEGVRLTFLDHPTYGKLASTAFLNDLKLPAKMSAEIVVELGDLAIERARDLSPKS